MNKTYELKYKVRPSNMDSFIQCPKMSILPNNMDMFTATIGNILHYAHSNPEYASYLIGLFTNEYEKIYGTSNILTDMLYKFVEKGQDFIKENQGKEIAYEAPIAMEINGVWVEGHPDVIVKNPDGYEIIDFKSSKSPSQYDDFEHKAQPFFYSYMVMIMLGLDKIKFSYYVYTKSKAVNKHIKSRDITLEEAKIFLYKMLDDYKDCVDSGIFEERKCSACYYCQAKTDGSCPLWYHGQDLN